MVFVGLARGFGGLLLLLQGSAADPGIRATEGVIWTVGAVLVLLGAILIIAGAGVFRQRHAWWLIGAACTLVFVVDGAINGWVLYGAPRVGGTITNVFVAAVILACLLAGKPALHRHQG